MKSIKTSTGINIHYEARGDKSAPAIIMIMGLGAQMITWPDTLYHGLVKKGFRVIRFDNRDVGLSSQLDQHGQPSLLKTWLSKRLPIHSPVPYKLEDMAQDVVELMAALNIKKAHLVGASMGGMIGQILAAKHRKKVLSLTSIMSTTSQDMLTKSNLRVMLKLARRPRKLCRESAIRYNIKLNRAIGSPAYPMDDYTLREHAIMNVDRAYNPAGVMRQMAAITASDDRRQVVKRIKAPTLVIHGAEDPIIPVARGRDTAQQIPKAKLKVVDGMGHDFPPELMAKMCKWIAKHVKKAENKAKLKRKAKQQGPGHGRLSKALPSVRQIKTV